MQDKKFSDVNDETIGGNCKNTLLKKDRGQKGLEGHKGQQGQGQGR